MKTIISKILAYLFAFSIILVILITAIDLNSFNKNFYETEFKKINNADIIQTDEQSLLDFTFVVLDYTQDKREDMVTYATIANEYREVFNQREKLHMEDVKALYLNAISLRNLAAILIVLIMMIFIVFKINFRLLAKAFIKTTWFALAIFAAILFYAILDFNNFWINFHYLFFDNDLWQLDPATSIMILMVPEQFFNDLVMRIIISFAIPLVICFLLAFKLRRNKVNE